MDAPACQSQFQSVAERVPIEAASLHERKPTAPLLQEDARIRLFPVLSHQISQEDYMVYRIGCSRITTVATSQLGSRAVRLIKSGKTIGQTKKILCAQLGIPEGQLDLSPVLDSLVKARMVRQIDEYVLEAERPEVHRIIRHNVQFVRQRLREWSRQVAIKRLPVNIVHGLLCFVGLRRQMYGQNQKLSQTKENLQRALGDVLPERVIATTAIAYQREQVRRAADVQLLRNLPPPKMVQWLQSGVQFTGLERLHEAQAERRGVILCGFHFGAPQLLVPFLWRRGISFVGAAAIPPFGGKNMAPQIVLDHTYAEHGVRGCGTVTWYTRFSFRGVVEMMKAVQRGETVLVFPDGYFSRPNREIANYFGHLAAEYRPAQVVVPFLGNTILANLMVPWLWLQTQAPLLPVKLLRRKAACFEVIIEPALRLSGDDGIQGAAEKLYQVLEQDIRLHPTCWNYWNRLHEFAAALPTKEEKLQATI